MKTPMSILLVVFVLLLSACVPTAPAAGPAASPVAPATTTAPTDTATTVAPDTATPKPTATFTATPTRQPTATKTPRPTIPPTATYVPVQQSSLPIFKQLESQGFAQMKLFQFSADLPQDEILYWYNLGQFVEFKFGGPHFKAPNPPLQLDVEGADGVNYSYLQYCTQEWVCRLLFLKTEGETVKLLADLDALKLAKGAWQTPSVLPYTWNDTNRNGLPELAITFLWGNSYDGSEVHIFEVQPNDTVVDLTAKVRGIITPWEFDPRSETFMVVDPAWAEHDCIYPGSPFSYWLYKWDGKKYSDATASGAYNLEGYIHELTSLVEGYYGEPFTPDFTIGPMVSVLLIYDKMGQRDAGWEAYLEMANPENWPGTDEAALEILQKDVTHFTRQYNSGQPFTPLPCSN